MDPQQERAPELVRQELLEQQVPEPEPEQRERTDRQRPEQELGPAPVSEQRVLPEPGQTDRRPERALVPEQPERVPVQRAFPEQTNHRPDQASFRY
jgi:hypothetical protein